MNVLERIIMILVIVLATMMTRFLPFLLFPANKKTPSYIKYLGKVLPPSIFGLLVIYCLKNVSLFSNTHALPELLAILFIIVIHLYKRKMLLSIALGTIFYMFLVQVIF